MTMLSTDKDGTCPYCLDRHEVASSIFHEHTPKDGDISLCITCGHFSVFDSTQPGDLRPPNKFEAVSIATDPGCQQLYAAWEATKKIIDKS